jgi:hypothetical protein
MNKKPAPKKTPKAPVAKQPATAAQEAAAPEAGPPFIRETLPNGRQAWRMSPALAKRYDELKRFVEIQDKEIQAAAVALLIAEHRLISNRNEDAEDYEQRPVSSAESERAFTGFMMPLARHLHTLRLPENSLPHRREEIRKEAVAWLESVIENAFSEYLSPGKLDNHLIEVIETTSALCYKNARIPDKAEIREAMEQRAEHQGLDKGTWRKRFEKAGLDDLKQRRGY